MIIGITGGIGSGKSTLSERLRKAGYAVYDTDCAARRLQNESSVIRRKIIDVFGPESYTNHLLNRKYMATIVFSQPKLLQQLNEIVHPAVRADFKSWIELHKDDSTLFLESALLFQGEFYKFVDKIILVTAPQSIRVQRVMRRDGVTENQVVERINNQLADSEMATKSDFILDTNATDIYKLDIPVFVRNLKV